MGVFLIVFIRKLHQVHFVFLLIVLGFFLFLASEGLLFISFFWASLHSLSSPTLGIWPGEGFYLPDPCELTFANTLLFSYRITFLSSSRWSFSLLSFFWGCSFPVKNQYFLSLRVSEVHLFFNSQLFYWHFLEFLWLLIFLVFYEK